LIVPAVGVTVPEVPAEPAGGLVARDEVEAKRVDRDALERRYGRLVTDDKGDFRGRVLETLISESDSCGDCRGSSTIWFGGRGVLMGWDDIAHR